MLIIYSMCMFLCACIVYGRAVCVVKLACVRGSLVGETVSGRTKRVGGEGNPEKACAALINTVKKACAALMNTVCVAPSVVNNFGATKVKVLSVSLANCPNLHTLDLSGE